jgi:hypothetical protein
MAAAAAFLSTYLECVESLPGELSKQLSRLCEIDLKTQKVLAELNALCEKSKKVSSEDEKKLLVSKFERNLYKLRSIGDEKGIVSSNLQETAEDHLRRLETSAKNFEKARVFEEPLIQPYAQISSSNRVEPSVNSYSEASVDKVRKSDSINSTNSRSGTKRHREEDYKEVKMKDQPSKVPSKKKMKVKKTSKQSSSREQGHHQQQIPQNSLQLPAATPVPDFTTEPIDPNEPTYCLCNQVSFGEMIGCDNEECSIEWFHFQCVGLTSKPKGKWYCPICRQDYKNSKNNKQ